MKIKIFSLAVLCAISTFSFADKTIKPVINGKTYNSFDLNLKTLPKPQKIIKGEPDECNGGNFPDEHDFGSYTVNDNNRIQTVRMLKNNAVIFYGQKIDSTITKANFQKMFKGKIRSDEEDTNRFHASSEQDEYKSITFYFKNNHLDHYDLWVDDC